MIKRNKDQGVLLTKEVYYTLILNQEQLDILEELLGLIGGVGHARDITNELQRELEKYASRDADSYSTSFFNENLHIEVK